jgi:nucleoside-diphosphate-sugar epimerase
MRVFVTGASGFIGSAVVPELITAGHRVIGLARSEASAQKLEVAGVEVVRGDIEDLDLLKRTAADADGVIHLAFQHDKAFSGRFGEAVEADRRTIEAFGDALAGTGRPFLLASGVIETPPGRLATERDEPALSGPVEGAAGRFDNARLTLALAERGVRSSVLRLPVVHGEGDVGFLVTLIDIARAKGVSGYIGDGQNRWSSAHRADVAALCRLAIEQAPAGSILHAVDDEGVPARAIAEAIGGRLGLPAVSIAAEDAPEHFGWLASFFQMDRAASNAMTRELLGWKPLQPKLIEDLEQDHYYAVPA